MTAPTTLGNWDHLRFALALRQYGSIAACARALHVNEVTVSRRIERVERELGMTLFARSRGSIVAAAGTEAFFDSLETLGEGMGELLSTLPDSRYGDKIVRVTTAGPLVNHVLVPALPDLLDDWPGLEVELVADPSPLVVMRERETDIAFRLERSGIERPEIEPDAIGRRVGTMEWAIYRHRDARIRGREFGWIAYARRSANRPFAIWIERERERLGGSVVARVDNPESLLQSVLAGTGCGLLPSALAARFGSLERVADSIEPLERELYMLLHPSSRQLPAMKATADWARTTLARFLETDDAPKGTRLVPSQ